MSQSSVEKANELMKAIRDVVIARIGERAEGDDASIVISAMINLLSTWCLQNEAPKAAAMEIGLNLLSCVMINSGETGEQTIH